MSHLVSPPSGLPAQTGPTVLLESLQWLEHSEVGLGTWPVLALPARCSSPPTHCLLSTGCLVKANMAVPEGAEMRANRSWHNSAASHCGEGHLGGSQGTARADGTPGPGHSLVFSLRQLRAPSMEPLLKGLLSQEESCTIHGPEALAAAAQQHSPCDHRVQI